MLPWKNIVMMSFHVSQIWSQISEGKAMTVELEMNQVYHLRYISKDYISKK